ncbi:MAG TPA: S-methyl-5'-thioadenosine phosphorylase [Polyangia bacterium]|nr:S-methyl-5'-thioadenosine phosphorylase [Polyangia bacterium]
MILGVFGGSGLYDLAGLEGLREHAVSTPFGEPSGPVVAGRLGDVEAEVLFLPRHGRGHRLLPSEINYRANVHALKQLGAERVLSISAVGSLKAGLTPGDVVLVDQFIDKTYRRATTFFGEGVAGHVAFGQPVCADLVAAVADAALATGFVEAPAAARETAAPRGSAQRLHRGGTYVCMEGPQFSTRAESLLHRAWGADTIGMTAATEAKLCREAELCFASLALVTDFDCWHDEEEAVTADAVVAVLLANVARARDVVRRVLPSLQTPRTCACGQAAAHAIMTAPEAIPASARERLRGLFGRYL